MDTVVAKLDQFAEIKAAAEVTRLDYEAKRAEILRVVQAELDALEAEFQPLLEAARNRSEALEAEIKQDVLEHGASVKSKQFYAVYNRGRVSWDTARLDKFSAAHPEVRQFRKEGQPSVSLRVVE